MQYRVAGLQKSGATKRVVARQCFIENNAKGKYVNNTTAVKCYFWN